jgi:hypothetical protein
LPPARLYRSRTGHLKYAIAQRLRRKKIWIDVQRRVNLAQCRRQVSGIHSGARRGQLPL